MFNTWETYTHFKDHIGRLLPYIKPSIWVQSCFWCSLFPGNLITNGQWKSDIFVLWSSCGMVSYTWGSCELIFHALIESVGADMRMGKRMKESIFFLCGDSERYEYYWNIIKWCERFRFYLIQTSLKTWTSIQNGRFFAGDIFTFIFFHKIVVFWLKFHLDLLPRVQLTTTQYWFR